MNPRKILFWIHLAAGCTAGSIILVMSVTGVLLAYQRQVISWADRSFHSATAPSGASRLPIEAMIAKIAGQHHASPSAITLHSEAAAPAEVSFGRDRVYLIDTQTGDVLGESSPSIRSFFQNVENCHRWLGAGSEHRDTARAVTGACNLGFLLLVVSGPFLWIPRKWSWKNVKSVASFRRGLKGRARDFNWHNVIGIWCGAPLCLIVLSGVVMSYPWANNLVYRITGTQPPASARRPERIAGLQGSSANLTGLDLSWAQAEKQVAGWQSITLRIPSSGRAPLAFTIDTGNGGRPDQRSQLTLDRRSGDILRWEPFSSYNAGRRLRSWLRFLHTGEAGGIPGQTVAGIASAGAVILVWTGLVLACRRFLRSRARRRSSVELPGEESSMVTQGAENYERRD